MRHYYFTFINPGESCKQIIKTVQRTEKLYEEFKMVNFKGKFTLDDFSNAIFTPDDFSNAIFSAEEFNRGNWWSGITCWIKLPKALKRYIKRDLISKFTRQRENQIE